MLISSFGKNGIFSRSENLRQLFLIAGGAHFTVMVTKDQSIGNLKTIQKCQQFFCLLSVVHGTAFGEKREHRITGQDDQVRSRPADQLRHRFQRQSVLFPGKHAETKVQVCQL